MPSRASRFGDVVFNVSGGTSETDDEVFSKIAHLLNTPEVNTHGDFVVNIARGTDDTPLQKEEKLEQMRRDLDRLNLQNASAKSQFTTWVHVLPTGLQREPEMFLAKVDTQSSDNWVRGEIIERLGMQGQIQELEPDASNGFQGATGEGFRASGHITLKWFETVVWKTRETQFLVNSAHNAPFDLILGLEWIKADGGSAFADPVLVMKEVALTEGRYALHGSGSGTDCDR